MDPTTKLPADSRRLEPSERRALAEDAARAVLSSHLFKSLDADGRERLLDCSYVRRFSAGDVVMKQGEHGDEMYMLLAGTLTVETRTPGGTVHLADLGPGACVGEVSLLSGASRTATVTATTGVECAAFDRPDIEHVLSLYPKVRDLLETVVEGRARNTIERMFGGP